MGLLDDARALQSERSAHMVRCPVSRILAAMDEPERSELVEAMEDRSITSGTLARVLRERGWEVNSEAIARHRRRARGTGCRCPA